MRLIFTFILVVFVIQVQAQWQIYNTTNTTELKSNMIKTVIVSNDDNIKWFGTDNGLSSFNGTTWSTFTSADDNLADDNINDMVWHGGGGTPEIWLGTQNGASVIRNGAIINPPYRRDNSGLVGNEVFATGVNTNSAKIFGTDRGLSTFSGVIWKTVRGLDSLHFVNYPITSIASSDDGYSYVATSGKGVYQYLSGVDGISLVTVYALPYNSLPSDNVTCVFVDKNGNQWYGSADGAGFHVGLAAKEGWSYYSTQEGLPDNYVNAIYQDKRGFVWFGTNNGLGLLKDEVWTIYTTANGLSSNRILDIAEDDDQRMWFATDNGITSYRPIWAGVDGKLQELSFSLNVHPNPAKDGVWIKYKIPNGGPTRVSVYDLSGRVVKNLENSFRVQGEHEIFWNTAGHSGDFVEEGIYIVKIESNRLVSTQKLIIMR